MHLLALVSLGLFWGLSPSLYKLMGDQGIPVTHIVVFTGVGVGLGLLFAGNPRARYVSPQIIWYGLGCGALLNLPFALSLEISRHVPVTDYALIVSTFPLFNYLLSLVIGREKLAATRVAAMALGFASSAILILGNRTEGHDHHLTWWTLATFVVPFLYTFYNYFCSAYWPRSADARTLGMAESFASAILAVPFLLWFDPPWSPGLPGPLSYWPLIVAVAIWVIERIAYFTLIRDRGPVFTGQGVFIATPASVLYGMIFFRDAGGWLLWLSLALLMIALWLNTKRA
ncbi:MAG: DMT family transporter [Hyphomicrobiales bacterium]